MLGVSNSKVHQVILKALQFKIASYLLEQLKKENQPPHFSLEIL